MMQKVEASPATQSVPLSAGAGKNSNLSLEPLRAIFYTASTCRRLFTSTAASCGAVLAFFFHQRQSPLELLLRGKANTARVASVGRTITARCGPPTLEIHGKSTTHPRKNGENVHHILLQLKRRKVNVCNQPPLEKARLQKRHE